MKINIFRKKKSFLDKALEDWVKIWQYPFFPYQWANEYKLESYSCKKDEDYNLFFVENMLGMGEGVKLYFPEYSDKEKTYLKAAMLLAIEQDLLSPHRYVTKENEIWGTLKRDENEIPKETPFFVESGDVVADIGASCGNFSISVIENAKHIYLFEADEIWNEPIKKTFEKYKDKITIVNKYVSDADTENTVTLDTFFKDKEINFIKADIEGYEQQLLNGAKNILERENVKFSICTYHKPQDAKDFETIFKKLGYETYFTDGYMFCPINNIPQNTSYLRKCILRAWKETVN